MLFFSVVIGFALYNIILWKVENDKTKKHVEVINDIVEINEVLDNEMDINTVDSSLIDSNDWYWKYINVNLLDVNFKNLKEINADIVGWVNVSGTNINYPFVQTKDNSFYLNHSIDKNYNSAGWVFLDYRNDVSSFDDNTVIYAHGRLDKSMFGSLRNILSSDWMNDKNNHIVRVSTEYENSLWQVFSVYRVPTTNDYIKIDFDSVDSYQNFIDLVSNRSKYDFNTTVSIDDKILTLSTCYDDYEKVVLHAKLIKYAKK